MDGVADPSTRQPGASTSPTTPTTAPFPVGLGLPAIRLHIRAPRAVTRKLAHAGIRARIISAVLALTALALLTAGFGMYLQARTQTLARITTSLNQTVDLLLALSQEPDPATGQPYGDPETLMQIALQRLQLSEYEGAFAFVDGDLWWTAPESVRVRPELDAEFIAQIEPLTELPFTTTGLSSTSTNQFQYIVIPVHFANGETGTLVHIYDMRAELAPLRTLYLGFALIGLVILAMIGLLIWLLINRLLAPITALQTTANQITEADLTGRVPIIGKDELAELSVTFNSMLDRLQTAVNSQRELLDDVGHELRTPLTIMRGNLEVMDTTDSADVVATKALVIDEVDRMHRLVEDLLLIAKADQIDFIRPELVAIADFTDDTFLKATALGERNWRLDELADCTATLDPQRTAQAWLQLAANAVQYSQVGTEIGLGSRVVGAEPGTGHSRSFELWVRDCGVGIAPDELATIVARRAQGKANRLIGADAWSHIGLGLAIVDSIVTAQGGQLRIASELGQGSTFTMIFPLG